MTPSQVSAVRTLRDAQRHLTRTRLLDAAALAFRTKGYAATTIDDVAAAAGATRATFYLHFTNKAELLGELVGAVEEEADDLNERLAEAVRVGDRRAISVWLDAAFDFWETVRYSAMAQEEAAAIEPEVRRARAESFDRGVGAIMRGLADAGRGDETSRRVRAVLIYSQLQNVFHRWMRVGWDVDRQEMLRVMTNMWLAALQEQGGAGTKRLQTTTGVTPGKPARRRQAPARRASRTAD
jgi:AcrR family transcriptional regulator